MPKYLHHMRRIHGITYRCSDFRRKKATLIFCYYFLFIFISLFLFFDQCSRLWTVLRERNWLDRLLFTIFIPPFALAYSKNIVLRAHGLVTLVQIIWHFCKKQVRVRVWRNGYTFIKNGNVAIYFVKDITAVLGDCSSIPLLDDT